MNLDDFTSFSKIDLHDMLAQVEALPDQLLAGWSLGMQAGLPDWSGVRQVLIAGVGGSAIAGELLAAYLEPVCALPIYLHRDYGLPAWAAGPETLVIACSHSGNTEETLSAYDEALRRGCRCLPVTTGGILKARAAAAGGPVWLFQHEGQPRSGVGYCFSLLLAAFARLNLLPDLQAARHELNEAAGAMRRQQPGLRADVPAARNPAKRLAGQMVDRHVVLFGAGLLAPVARRWKDEINEAAKAWAQFEILPEANHNTQAALLYPEEVFGRMLALFLHSPSDHPRNQRRLELTRHSFLVEGLNTDFVEALGETRLAQQWTALHFGDYVTYYLAMAYGVDPTPVLAIEALKRDLA
jgi:glucose/mannose-6-phosphate isomerase